MEKEHNSQLQVKAQLHQYKQLLVEMGKPLDSRADDTLSSTSSLLEGDVRTLIEMRKVSTTTKSWAKDNISKVKLFLQHTIGIY